MTPSRIRDRSGALLVRALLPALLAGCAGCGAKAGDMATAKDGGGGADASASGGAGTPGGGRAGTGASTGGAGGSTGSAGQGGGGAGAAISAEQFWSMFAQALCHRYAHCVGEPYARPQLKALEAGDESKCAQALDRELLGRSSVSALDAAVTAGVLHIDAAEVQRCLQSVTSCAFPPGQLPNNALGFTDFTLCREVFDGNVAAGGMCEIDAECSGEAFCQLATGDGGSPSCYGTCVARVGAGQGCINLQCAAPPPPALGWPICSNGGTCTVTTVMAPAAEGQPCATSTPAATITPCADDLWCDTSRLVCTASAPLGGACGTVAACASGSCKPYCLDGNCVSGTCSAYTVRRTAGQPCDDATVLCDTFASLMCVGGTCTTVDGSTGSACSPVPWYEATVCASRHSCGASRQCGATGGQSTGQACSQDDDCAGGICEFRRRACIPALCSAT